MCGITGLLGGIESPSLKRDRVANMLGQLAHRGPDAFGTYIIPEVALGHVRLSIIDVRDGHQPFSRGKHVLSYNGEIYNYLELRAELQALGEVFQTKSDTEVLLVALMRFGLSALPRCNGQFAFLYWNGDTRTLYAVRDRYGVRPLYTVEHQGGYAFASEMRAFDALQNFERRIKPEHLLEHGLLWNTLGDRTVYEGIRSVEAGTALVFKPGHPPQTERYHQIGEGSPDAIPSTFEEAKVMIREKLRKAVSLRLRSEVPVGAYLSGGIDSSVVALLTDELRADRFQTFSIAFSDPQYDESRYQAMMVSRLKTDCYTLTVDYAAIRNNFESAVLHGERPIFRTAPVPLYLLAKAVREAGIRVVLTGEGADEILWGYDTFKELKLLQFWAKFPNSRLRPLLLRTLYPHLAHYSDSKQLGLMRMFYEGFLGSYNNQLVGLNLRVHNNRILANYLHPERRPTIDDEGLMERIRSILPANWQVMSLLQRNQFLEMRTLLPGYLLSSQGDRMSLAHGIEGRYPFLDPEIVEWAFHLPDHFKLPLMSQKHLLREAFRPDVPAEIIDRPKQPYQAPDLKAFFPNGKLCELGQQHLGREAIESTRIFDGIMVNRFLNKWNRGIPENIGYRDNMIFTFLLSTQILAAHARAGSHRSAPQSPRTIDHLEPA
jgi:asparagine synthase (glutamine-hydrolysing)